MGCTTSDSRPSVKVATLNFSGICISPFQYHDCTIQKDQLSSKFDELLEKQLNNELKPKSKQKQKNIPSIQQMKQSQKERPEEKSSASSKFEWKVGDIDKQKQKERYAPVYNKNVGLERGKLLNREEFKAYWDEYYKKIKPDILQKRFSKSAIDNDKSPKSGNKNYVSIDEINEEERQCKIFDILCYETILHVVYGKGAIEEMNLKRVKEWDPLKYQNFMYKWHNKAYVNTEKKMGMVAKYIKDKNLDVMFLQQNKETNHKQWEDFLEGYEVVRKEGVTSIIIYRKSLFGLEEQDKVFRQKIQKAGKLNFNNKTVFIKIGRYLLISSHLSSKKDISQLQGNKLYSELDQLRNNPSKYFQDYQIEQPRAASQIKQSNQNSKSFETHKNIKNKNTDIDSKNKLSNSNDKNELSLKILMGIDANYFFYKQHGDYSIFPANRYTTTTAKKRTSMQLQTHKKNVLDLGCKDYIFTTEKLLKCRVQSITPVEENQKKFLPNEQHPFDHYLIQGEVEGILDQ